VGQALADAETTAVVACAMASNGASLRVLEKLGLTREGEVLLPGSSEPTVTLARRK
jgi:RimJ/RimL family protein N-acetyltransferase